MKAACKTNQDQSDILFDKAQKYMPGGVNSPVRAFQAVGGIPRFISSAEGAYLFDVDQNRYLDYVGSWGPMILGHKHPAVVTAVISAVDSGLSFGAPCELETELAQKICQHMRSIDQIRFVNSGTEAAMSALRLARAATGRSKIVKFEGCYHGHADSLLVKAGSGALTLGVPSSKGVTKGAAQDTLIADFNDQKSVTALFESEGQDIAAIIVEPMAANMNFVPASVDFIAHLRKLCDQFGALLIFDEVITGFRVGLGGAQQYYNIFPDLTVLGKIIGGGLPVGAYGGRRDLMAQIAPLGPVYQAGTLSGNPITMAAGLATLKELEKEGFYSSLEEKTKKLVSGLLEVADSNHIALQATVMTGLFGLFFTEEKNITQYSKVLFNHSEKFKVFFHQLLNRGIYLAPSSFEAGFLSSAHTDQDIEETIRKVDEIFQSKTFLTVK